MFDEGRDIMTIGERIRKRREQLHFGLTELADKVNISKQALYKYENDIVTNIPSNKIEELAKALQTTPAYLMGWDEEILPTDTILPVFDQADEHLLKIIEYYKDATPEARSVAENLLKLSRQEP